MLWQFLATLALVVGGWYIWWRWTSSLNPDAMWFAISLVLAETFAYVGLILFVYNLWRDQPIEIRDPPPHLATLPRPRPRATGPCPSTSSLPPTTRNRSWSGWAFWMPRP